VKQVTTRVEAFAVHHPKLGPFLYLLGLQYFIIQVVVALDWSPSYSVSRYTISDLGNTACGRFNGRYVCSPLHTWMNVSFVILGATMVVGTVLIYHGVATNRNSSLGYAFLGVGGLGVVIVGVFPENTVPALHGVGASLPFLVGNVGLLLLGLSLKLPFVSRLITVMAGAVSLLALVLYTSTHYLGLGEGGMERVVAYPQTLWMILFGAYLIVKPSTRGSVRVTTPTPGN
jgi:hypothetical membrane protein